MEIVNLLSTQLGQIKFLLGFVVLPFLYLRESISINKEIGYLLFDNDKVKNSKISKDDIKEWLHIFDLEWWAIIAITIGLLAIFLMGDIVQKSTLLSECQEEAVESVTGIVNTYSIILALISIFIVQWRKLNVYKQLRKKIME